MLNLFDSQLKTYQRIREQSSPCMTRAAKDMPKDLLFQAAKDLKLLGRDGKTFVLDEEQEIEFILDRAIHDIPWPKKRWVEQIHERSQNEADKTIFQAHLAPIFSLYEVLETIAGRGARLIDLFRGGEVFVMDVGLGSTSHPGMLLATRIIVIEDIPHTSGVSMPFEARERKNLLGNFEFLKEIKGNLMGWDALMRKYCPYFFHEYKKGGKMVELGTVSENLIRLSVSDE